MSNTVISVEHLSKQYDLGVIGTGTLSRDLNRWWARLRKQPDPYTRIGQKDAFSRIGETILALNDVNFSVQQGEALGIIGRNGAGKSTLLKVLSRVTSPTSGVVKVKGRIGSLLEIGTGFHPELTGRENVYLNGAILGMKKAEVARKFDEIIDFSGVEKFIDTPVKRYSSGMYVRLAFAVAAHLDPEILIVDEVLAVGDAEFQKKCLGKMGDVAHDGRTVLFVSHNMSAIESLCKNASLFDHGKLIALGPVSQVVKQYMHDNKSIGIVNRDNRKLKLIGSTYKEYCIDEDIEVKLTFQTDQVDLEQVKINIAILDSTGMKIIRLQSELLGETFSLLRETTYEIAFQIKKPNLVPGIYSLDVYLWDADSEICWIQSIPAFEIVQKPLKNHKKLFYDQVGYIMPEFSITCKNAQER